MLSELIVLVPHGFKRGTCQWWTATTELGSVEEGKDVQPVAYNIGI